MRFFGARKISPITAPPSARFYGGFRKKGRTRPAKGASLLFSILCGKLEFWVADSRIARGNDKIVAFAPLIVVYENLEGDVAFGYGLFPEPFVFADALHRDADVPVESAAETANEQLVAPTRVIFCDDSRGLFRGLRFFALLFGGAFAGCCSGFGFLCGRLFHGSLGCCFFDCFFCSRHFVPFLNKEINVSFVGAYYLTTTRGKSSFIFVPEFLPQTHFQLLSE